MAKNKIFTGMSKVAIAAVLVSAIGGTTAFAAEHDIRNKDGQNLGTISDILLKNKSELFNLIKNLPTYTYETNGKLYKANEINNLFATGSTTGSIAKDAEKLQSVGEASDKLAVSSVKAINATQVEVKFTQEIDKTSAAGATYTIATIDGVAPAATTLTYVETKADNKTVILKANKALEKRYQVKISAIDSKADSSIKTDAYNEVLNFAADTTAPTVTNYEQLNANTVRINFSEPVDALAASGISFKDSEGNAITKGSAAGQIPSATILADETYFDVDLTNIDANEKVTVTFNGLKDLAGNLVNPQPSSIVVEKKVLATFAPTISSVKQTGAKTFNIKFSEDLDGTLDGKTTITLSPTNAVTAIKKVSASEYKVTVTNNLSGLTTVTVPHGDVVGSLGQIAPTTNLTKLVTFTKDTGAPKATAKLVKDKNNKEVIELTFDKDVKLEGSGEVTVAGSYVKDYVSKPVNEDIVAIFPDSNNKKVLHIGLSAVELNQEGAAYDLSIVNKTPGTDGIFSDADVDMAKSTTSFTRGKDGVAANTRVLKAADIDVKAVAGDNDKVEVEFTIQNGELLDGATATNIANYTIDGAQIKSATLKAVVGGTKQSVILTLKENSNTFTGVRNATVKNVKIAGSTKVMEPVTKVTSDSLQENIAPTVKKAELTATNKVTITFSEAVITKAVNTDFSLLIGGTIVAANDEVTTPLTASPGGTTVEFTLEDDVTAADINSTLSLKALSTLDIVDTAGNKLSVPANISITE